MKLVKAAVEAYAAEIREINRLERLWHDKRNLEEALKRREALRVKVMKSHGIGGWAAVLQVINDD